MCGMEVLVASVTVFELHSIVLPPPPIPPTHSSQSIIEKIEKGRVVLHIVEVGRGISKSSRTSATPYLYYLYQSRLSTHLTTHHHPVSFRAFVESAPCMGWHLLAGRLNQHFEGARLLTSAVAMVNGTVETFIVFTLNTRASTYQVATNSHHNRSPCGTLFRMTQANDSRHVRIPPDWCFALPCSLSNPDLWTGFALWSFSELESLRASELSVFCSAFLLAVNCRIVKTVRILPECVPEFLFRFWPITAQ